MKLLNFEPGELKAQLEQYLANDAKYKAVFDYTKQRFEEATDFPAHNWPHAYRDTLNAIVIGEAEGANMSVVLPATTMHDIGFLYGATGKTHGAVGANNLRQYLREGGIEYGEDSISKLPAVFVLTKAACMMKSRKHLKLKSLLTPTCLKSGPSVSIKTFVPLRSLIRRLSDHWSAS